MKFEDKVLTSSRSDDIQSLIYLKIYSKAASSGPPIGPILGQYGIPAGPFCAEFNERTAIFNSKVELFVTIFLYRSGSYDFSVDLPSTAFFIKRALRAPLGTIRPGWVPCPKDYYSWAVRVNWRGRWRHRRRQKEIKRSKVITIYMLYEILRYKSRFDILRLSDYSEYQRGLGTLRSMGVHLLLWKYSRPKV